MIRFPFASQHVSIGPRGLQGYLDTPDEPQGLVLFVHEHGCGRHNPEDNQVAAALHKFGFATLLVDLFDPKERFEFSAAQCETELPLRIGDVIDWARIAPPLKDLELYCVGSGDIAEPLLRTTSTKNPAVVRIALVAPAREPDKDLITRAPPTLIMVKPIHVPNTGQPGATPPHGLPLDNLGRGRLEETARQVAEWFSRARSTSVVVHPNAKRQLEPELSRAATTPFAGRQPALNTMRAARSRET